MTNVDAIFTGFSVAAIMNDKCPFLLFHLLLDIPKICTQNFSIY